jgi:hypothetical protein
MDLRLLQTPLLKASAGAAGKGWTRVRLPEVFHCFHRQAPYFPLLYWKTEPKENVNSELCRLALLKVVNPNVLINLVSRRVRQLNSGGGNLSRPLLNDTTGLGAADIALTEIIEDKMGWEMPEELGLAESAPKKRNKRG